MIKLTVRKTNDRHGWTWFATENDKMLESGGTFYSQADAKHAGAQFITEEFARLGYVALYGGRKGHGFWIYKSTVEAVAIYDAAWAIARTTKNLADGADIPGECVKNDGKRSGNECFWMMRDALQLLADVRKGLLTNDEPIVITINEPEPSPFYLSSDVLLEHSMSQRELF